MEEVDTILKQIKTLRNEASVLVFKEIETLATKAVKKYSHITDFCMAMGSGDFSCKCNHYRGCTLHHVRPEVDRVLALIDQYDEDLHITGIPIKITKEKTVYTW